MWLLSVMTEKNPYFSLHSEQLAVDGTDSHASLHNVLFSVAFCSSVETLEIKIIIFKPTITIDIFIQVTQNVMSFV